MVYLYKHVKHFHHYEADYKLRVTLWSEMHNLMISIFACGSHTPARIHGIYFQHIVKCLGVIVGGAVQFCKKKNMEGKGHTLIK